MMSKEEIRKAVAKAKISASMGGLQAQYFVGQIHAFQRVLEGKSEKKEKD